MRSNLCLERIDFGFVVFLLLLHKHEVHVALGFIPRLHRGFHIVLNVG